MTTLPRVRRTLLRDTAYEVIRDAIVRADIPPGAVVSNATVAEQLGLSRAPVRDALARLADEGLVETKPQSYTRVTPLALKEVRDAAEVVRAMHELAVRAAVPLLTATHIEAMREANRRFEAATLAADVDAAMDSDAMRQAGEAGSERWRDLLDGGAAQALDDEPSSDGAHGESQNAEHPEGVEPG